MQRLTEAMTGRCEGSLLPFLWLRGEPGERLIEELRRVAACGVRQVCLESRPHPDFAGPGWWRDVDLLLAEAKRLGMRLWILDDDRFPTGHCNGLIASKYPERARQFLMERHADVMGLEREATLRPVLPGDAQVLHAVACRKPSWDGQRLTAEDARTLTDGYDAASGLLRFTLPRGRWRVFILYTTRTGGSRADYMNLIDRESVATLIEAVYEPHYQRYAADFGGAIAGFFSDEPELGNMPGYEMDATLGMPGQRLPWSAELAARMTEAWGGELAINLLALWYDVDDRAPACRYRMMREVAALVRACFSEQLGQWCRARGVEYIGHIIEDAGAHARVGCSIGHYFQEMRGQDMAGVDVVHFQILPGFDAPVHRWIDWEEDGAFFHYGLAKLAASEAVLDEKKKGRALCEIFGNYGWAEGVSLMRWLADHMLARGVNRFVPHAFSPAEFPDRECPPHFYAQGQNPEYPFFQELCRMMERACRLMEGGTPVTDAAVLYHAESEWCGGKAMPFHTVGRELLRRQMDYCVIPAFDLLRAEWTDGGFRIGAGEFRVLVIPECEFLPAEAAAFALEARRHHVGVLAVNRAPDGLCDGTPLPEGLRLRAVPLEALADAAEALWPQEVALSRRLPGLRLRRVRQPDGLVVYLFNEDPYEEAIAQVDFKGARSITVYDPWTNRAERFAGGSFPMRLLPGQATVLLLTDDDASARPFPAYLGETVIDPGWEVRFGDAPAVRLAPGEYPSLTAKERFGPVCGTFGYSARFQARPKPGRRSFLRLTGVGDAARVWLNGAPLGSAVGSARLEMTAALREGENELRIDVTNTLFWTVPDNVSGNMCVPPTGLSAAPVMEEYGE